MATNVDVEFTESTVLESGCDHILGFSVWVVFSSTLVVTKAYPTRQ